MTSLPVNSHESVIGILKSVARDYGFAKMEYKRTSNRSPEPLIGSPRLLRFLLFLPFTALPDLFGISRPPGSIEALLTFF